MNNSHSFFENKECEYYPCHRGIEEMNCLFCYCPLYHMEDCPGDHTYKEKNGRPLKVCTDCTFPHRAENYDEIMRLIKENR